MMLLILTCIMEWRRPDAEENFLKCLLFCLNAVVAVKKGMRTVKLCSNKILQFLTVIAG